MERALPHRPLGSGPSSGAAPIPAESPSAITLAWIVRLRWGAIIGQSATIAAARLGFGLELPIAPLAVLIALAAGSNVALLLWLRRRADVSTRTAGIVLVADTLILTGLLHLSGGPSNPFSVLYLVHVTLAALVLGIRWASALVATAAASFAALFFWYRPIAGMEHAHHGGSAYSVHLQGMWIAFFVAASLIAYFVARVAAALRDREALLAKAGELAARNEKLVSLSALAAGAAHELGTPLGTIAIAVKELERTLSTDPSAALDDARLIRNEVDRCRDIVRRMGARAGASMGELPETVSSSEVVLACKERIQPPLSSRLDVVADEPVELVCCVDGLVQVLESLVQNALQASPEDARVRLIALPDGDASVRFVVEDDGVGIPPEELLRIGEPFFTTKAPGEGMGLGVFLAHAFADRSGGALRFESSEGKGTRVELSLPRAPRRS